MNGGLFRRPRDHRPECGTWRRGELAVCVREDCVPALPQSPRVGDILRVSAVLDRTSHHGRWTCLCFEGKPACFAWSANGFRKPVEDNSGADEAVEQLIKGARPARAPALVPAGDA